MTAIGAYILIVIGVAVWAIMVPAGKQMPAGLVRGITVFGGAFLLAVCCLEMLPEMGAQLQEDSPLQMAPYIAVLVGFLIQQVLDSISAHAEHGHTEDGFTLAGLMLGLSLHALIEGMPLVESGMVNHGLLWGIIIHNIPVALILVGLMSAKGYGLGRVLTLLLLFGIMSPLGSLLDVYILRPDPQWQAIIAGLVVGVLLHVSSSILFDHKRNHFSWLNVGIMTLAFVAAGALTLN